MLIVELKKLENALNNQDEVKQESILSIIGENHLPEKYLPCIFFLMETNPDAPYGLPGPIVHFIEGHVGLYESLLFESLMRCPISHTLWMLNRLINVQDSSFVEAGLNLLREIASRDDIPESLRDEAMYYYKYQISENS